MTVSTSCWWECRCECGGIDCGGLLLGVKGTRKMTYVLVQSVNPVLRQLHMPRVQRYVREGEKVKEKVEFVWVGQGNSHNVQVFVISLALTSISMTFFFLTPYDTFMEGTAATNSQSTLYSWVERWRSDVCVSGVITIHTFSYCGWCDYIVLADGCYCSPAIAHGCKWVWQSLRPQTSRIRSTLIWFWQIWLCGWYPSWHHLAEKILRLLKYNH